MSPFDWALAALGAFMIGVAKTGVAGLGVLAVALFAGVMPARESVGVVLVILVAADLVAVAVYRRNAEWKQLLRLFPWAAAGIGIGTVTLGRIDDGTVRVLIGAILVTLVVIRVVRDRRGGAGAPGVPPNAGFAALTGLAAGFTTMVANAAGPIMVLYLLAMRLPKLAFIGTSAWFFLAINLFKVPFSYHLGLISLGSVAVSARLWPFAIAGALSGRWLIERINQRRFEALALALTLIAGVRLLLP